MQKHLSVRKIHLDAEIAKFLLNYKEKSTQIALYAPQGDSHKQWRHNFVPDFTMFINLTIVKHPVGPNTWN